MNSLNFFDRFGIMFFWGSDSEFIDRVALCLTDPLLWVPLFVALLYLVLHNHPNSRERLICIGAVCVCLALSAGVCNLIVKPLVCRIRPCNVEELRLMFHIPGGYGEKNYSFFSSHAANYMGLTTFFFLLVRKKIMTVAMILLTLVNIWTRLYLGQHYLSDICVGLLWGVVSGTLAWQVYKKYSQGRPDFSNADPLLVASVFFATVILTLLYCI